MIIMNTQTDTQVKSNSTQKVLGICLIIAAFAFIAITFFKISPLNMLFAVSLLLFPLLHIWMMRSGNHKH